ncbi:prolyl-tRNA editing enzyme YbaK/EbsC (Cys-tRNA(Pro) deacylase) [Sphingopyxis sp. OAS728]|uniref:YbaK/EbsC family protein n=1 Tax=Sphingopyxis sp. OAS728 TaxID=2663823 RepID=UPI0017890B10|nr:YbaK/EbsC family protein [Sphingopyxis sp. OAS728]MBE1527998.1 prolyl-tRNA editing enzyme YbaK/EbsC (Cys-tRNA(Pro) deacylase) [Sphingopyxis sp. OAS728]
MKPASSSSALRYQEEIGSEFIVLEFDESTRSAAEAAATIGCREEQIAKCIVLRGKTSDTCILAIAPGPSRIDMAKVAAIVGEPVTRPDAAFVRERTGYAIGGVPPIPAERGVTTLVAAALADVSPLWAAAGTPNAVFTLTYEQLCAVTAGREVDILADAP